MGTEAIIRAEGICKSFGNEEILHNISCCFSQGKIHGVVGNNGSGKTVFFKCLCGFIPPTKGEVYWSEKQLYRDIDFPESLGLIIETPGFLLNESGLRNLQILAALKKIIGKEQITDAMTRVGLDPLLKKNVGKYSLGMRQRLGIAQAIMEDPSVLILDEPFNGLDKLGMESIREMLKEFCDQGKTILLSSHNQYDIDILCDFVYEMDAGVMRQI